MNHTPGNIPEVFTKLPEDRYRVIPEVDPYCYNKATIEFNDLFKGWIVVAVCPTKDFADAIANECNRTIALRRQLGIVMAELGVVRMTIPHLPSEFVTDSIEGRFAVAIQAKVLPGKLTDEVLVTLLERGKHVAELQSKILKGNHAEHQIGVLNGHVAYQNQQITNLNRQVASLEKELEEERERATPIQKAWDEIKGIVENHIN